GRGELKYPNGAVYEGDIIRGKRHGFGELYHVQENKKYFGGFSEDLKDGFGVEVMGNGERYYGGWKNGLYHHMGTYQYIDGSYFQGEFKRGTRKGKGKLYLATGDVIEGTWSGDK
ncbi:predicted protein, partial [Naegleria gruberi]